MPSFRIAAVMRSGVFSPNHVGNDANILNSVADQLRKRGCEVRIYTEEQLAHGAVDEPVVINMCREEASVAELQRLEDLGRLVVNSGYGIENCIRERQARILIGSGLPYPESIVADTNEAVERRLREAGMSQCWIKRADFHSQHAEDVSYVRTPEEAQDVLQEYFLRGFRRAVISRHLPGQLVKFYGVAGTDFFHWFLPYEPIDASGAARPENIDLETRLKDICARGAHELNLKVYGGECIQDAGGQLRIIDFNDWPSFAPCRAAAAKAIAKAVLADAKARDL